MTDRRTGVRKQSVSSFQTCINPQGVVENLNSSVEVHQISNISVVRYLKTTKLMPLVAWWTYIILTLHRSHDLDTSETPWETIFKFKMKWLDFGPQRLSYYGSTSHMSNSHQSNISFTPQLKEILQACNLTKCASWMFNRRRRQYRGQRSLWHDEILLKRIFWP